MSENKICFADNFFNIKLYLQALKRLKVIGLVTLVCMMLFSVFSIIHNNLGRNSIEYVQAHSGAYFMMTFVVIIIVPLMVLILFHYLTTRNGSDFYHSLAQKRRSVYFSFVAAVVTWAMIIIVCFTLVTTIAYMLVSKLCILSIANILAYSFNILISCILVTVVFALGCSITGTVFSSLVASACILVLPRLIITIFSYMIASESLILSTDNIALLASPSCNLPVEIIFDDILSLTYNNSISSFGFSTLYTFILAIIYLLIGCKMYEKRPSETAGKAASSKKIQYCLRMIIGYLITLFIVVYLYPVFVHNRSYIKTSIDVLILIFLIAAFVMFLYELITSRTLKSALKALLHSPILLPMDAATIGLLLLINSYTLNNVPAASTVDYIKVDIYDVCEIWDLTNDFPDEYTLINDQYTVDYGDNWTNNNYYYNGAYPDYIFQRLSDIELTDKVAIEAASTALNEYCSQIKKNPNLAEGSYYHDEASDTDIYYLYEFRITYGTGHSELIRHVRMTASDAKVIINSLLESTEANDIMHSLPEYDKTGTYVSNPNLSDDEVKEIYNTFREEIKNVSMTDYLNTVISSHTVTSLDLYDNEASTPSSTQLYLTSATPNAFSLYMKYYNEHNQNSFDEKLSTALNSTDDYRAYLTAYIYDYADNTVYYATDRDSSGSDRDLLIYADSILDEAAVPIPENFKENFNPETCYICLMYIDLYALYEEYYPGTDLDVITMNEYSGSGGIYFLLNKSYDLNKLFNEFSDGFETRKIYVP